MAQKVQVSLNKSGIQQRTDDREREREMYGTRERDLWKGGQAASVHLVCSFVVFSAFQHSFMFVLIL